MIKRVHAVGKKSNHLTHVVAVFDDREAAHSWAASANRWYGEGHPLTPLVVMSSDVLHNPKNFPDPSNLDRIFEDIDKDQG